MSEFSTTDGRKWQLAVNVLTVKRVREMAGVNVLALLDDAATVASVFSDHVKLAEVLAACVHPQLEASGVSLDEFLTALDGTAVEAATEALVREVANFFQEPRRSILLKALDKVTAKVKAANAEGAAEALNALETMDIPMPSPSMLTSSVSSSPASAA